MRAAWTIVIVSLGAAEAASAACGGARNASEFHGLASGGADAAASGGGGEGNASGGSGAGASDGAGSSGGGSTGSGAGGEPGSAPSPGGPCSGAATNFAYVLSSASDLYRFAPRQKQFTKIGRLGCSTSLTPNSMAVDRNAVAWVNYYDATGSSQTGQLRRVSTADASCEPSAPIALPPAFFHVGMGFSTDGANPAGESLYLAADDNQRTYNHYLGRVDATTGQVQQIGLFSPMQPFQTLDAELTGTGDGRLYGFFISLLGAAFSQQMYPLVGLVDKATGAVQSPVTMTGVQQPTEWAFSFWGGHFYLYTSQGPGDGDGSDVADYDPASGTIDAAYMTGVGFDVVGAGVSTCAPTTPPPAQ